MARKQKKERRKEALAAAKRLLSREGMQAASVRRVAEEAEMSAGSLRHIFPSHDELFIALFEDGRKRSATRLKQLQATPAGSELCLAAAVDTLLALLPLSPGTRVDLLVQLAVQTDHPNNPVLVESYRETCEQLDELCRAIVATTVAPHEVAEAALELRLVLDGVTMRVLSKADFGEAEARAALNKTLRRLRFL
ncbi:transcriptional regulator BetI [Corynebacterium occultum]|uniref:Transcriptional regulator BetI n=1 Tax=Corynebacterium occultum TaxID=2675219 RepID=A0A6B8W6Z4_9CORY|nr:TetR/AcrR family transcriptional regulator [Corynebacterium occultum]QGU08401.1 transcriptional regulator BetI [Corynebacterium occultum]